MKLKQFTTLMAFCALLVLSSCEKDLYEQSIKQSKYKMMIVNSSELEKNSLLMNKIAKSNFFNKSSIKKNNSSSRIIYDSINGYYLDTDKVKYIEGEGFKSYTFEVIKPDKTFLDNLVLISKNDEEYKPYALRYNLSEEEIKKLNTEEYIDFTNKCLASEIEESNSMEEILAKFSYEENCNMVYTWQEVITYEPCANNGCHPYPVTLEYHSHVLIGTMVCTGGGGGGNMGGEIGTSPNGGGGGAVDTTPVANPCNKIKDQNTKFPSINQSLTTLSTTTSLNHESGIYIDNSATSSTNPVQTITSNTSIGGTIPLNMNPTNSYLMIAHTHDSSGTDGSGTYSIFSWDDLTTINNLINNNHIDNSKFVFYVITADGTRYALTIDSPTDLSNFFYDPSNLPFGAQVDMGKLFKMQAVFEKYYDKSKNGLITTTSSANNDKSNFLKFIKEANLGITLFEVDATFTNYQKLSISNNGIVSSTPCK